MWLKQVENVLFETSDAPLFVETVHRLEEVAFKATDELQLKIVVHFVFSGKETFNVNFRL